MSPECRDAAKPEFPGALKAAEIGQKVGRVIARFKVAKHFDIVIRDGQFAYHRLDAAIEAEAKLDGIYVIRTSEPARRLSADDAVRTYKGLAQVEQLFRGLKGLEVLIRPIRHREERRVRAHIFLCLLAGYLRWHLNEAWAPLLFNDQSLEQQRKIRDPVVPAKPTLETGRKKVLRCTEDGLPLQSFSTLIAQLGTRCHHICRVTFRSDSPEFRSAHRAHAPATACPRAHRYVPSAGPSLNPNSLLNS